MTPTSSRKTRGPEDRQPRRAAETQPGFLGGARTHHLKVIRTDLGVERRELAVQAGISCPYLTEIENGNRPPSSAVLSPIAVALGLRMSQLIDAAEARMERRSGAAGPEGLQPAVRGSSAAPGSIATSGAVAAPQILDHLQDALLPTVPLSPRRERVLASVFRAARGEGVAS